MANLKSTTLKNTLNEMKDSSKIELSSAERKLETIKTPVTELKPVNTKTVNLAEGVRFGSVGKNFLDFSINEGITNIKIASYAFDGNTLIKSVDLGHSVTAINACAFRGYSSATSSLVSVIIPSSCITIGSNAFQYCNSGCVIHCEAESQPSGWNSSWNSSSATVDWGYVRS